MLQWIAQKWLKILGWKILYSPLPSTHGVFITYPHTSNWDFLYGVLWKFAVNLQPRWIAKDAWFRPPFGWFMRRLGGIGIQRNGQLDLTSHLKKAMLNEQTCWLGIAIEGTRSYKTYIHMGYYHIAHAANIPLGIVVIDYANKTVGIRSYRQPKDNIQLELAQLALDFSEVGARYPEKVSDLMVRPVPF